MAKAKKKPRNGQNGGQLGFEAQLWATADKLRGTMEPSDYKHVALGLIFLKYISDAFETKRAALLADDLADAEDPEEYLAENVFRVPTSSAPLSPRRGSANARTSSRCWKISDSNCIREAQDQCFNRQTESEYCYCHRFSPNT